MSNDTSSNGSAAYLPRTMHQVVALLAELARRGDLRAPVPAPDDAILVAGARQVNSVRPAWARYPALVAVHYLASIEADRPTADRWAADLAVYAQASATAAMPSIAATRQAHERVRSTYLGHHRATNQAAADQLLASWRSWYLRQTGEAHP